MEHRPAIPACLIAGVLFGYCLFFLQIPPYFLSLPAAVFICAILFAQKNRRTLFFVALGFALCTVSLQLSLADRFDEFVVGESRQVTGQVSGLVDTYEDYSRFRFRTDQSQHPDLPAQLLVHWYRDPPDIKPGQLWRLEVQLRPPWGLVNFQGADRERWMFAEGIGGIATVKQGELLESHSWRGTLDYLRQYISHQIEHRHTGEGSQGVVRALAVADRSGISKSVRDTLALTGTAHLLAISGLHVGLAYLFIYWLVRGLGLLFSRWLSPAHGFACIAGWLGAFVYAGLAGFSTSTVRALIMLTVMIILILQRRRSTPFHSWLLALAAVLLLEPKALLQAGTWMSFAAVAALLMMFVPRYGMTRGFLFKLLAAQLAVMSVTFPLSLWWFQLASPASLLSNLLAIPWISFIVVPMVLLALLLWSFNADCTHALLNVAGQAGSMLMNLLEPVGQWALPYSFLLQPSLIFACCALIAGCVLLLPRGLKVHVPALLLLLPLVLPPKPLEAAVSRLEVLDVGQGTAILWQSDSGLLLYDSGPGNGKGGDLVSHVIGPSIRASGYQKPDLILISHSDLDHAGGLVSLRQAYPDVPVFGSLPSLPAGIGACDDTQTWHWNNTRIKVLHPSPALPYLGNDSSCVVAIENNVISLLLTGDISSVVEQRLVNRGLPRQSILLVPHHGSRSSSANEFLLTTAPQFAIATSGLGNRFGFPREEVKARYASAGIDLLSTDQCGAIRVEINQQGKMELSSARRQYNAPWRWPAGDECP